jgi:NDP-sugar pyrophosphorylase family protein
MVRMQEFVQRLLSSPLSSWRDRPPWSIVMNAEEIVRETVLASREPFERRGTIAVQGTATIEAGAVVKGPAIIGAECFIADGAYLRGGVWLDERCSIGPGSELKSSFMFSGSKLAHLNFVGDSTWAPMQTSRRVASLQTSETSGLTKRSVCGSAQGCIQQELRSSVFSSAIGSRLGQTQCSRPVH